MYVDYYFFNHTGVYIFIVLPMKMKQMVIIIAVLTFVVFTSNTVSAQDEGKMITKLTLNCIRYSDLPLVHCKNGVLGKDTSCEPILFPPG